MPRKNREEGKAGFLKNLSLGHGKNPKAQLGVFAQAVKAVKAADSTTAGTQKAEEVDSGPSFADEIFRKMTGKTRSAAARKFYKQYPVFHMLTDMIFREKAKVKGLEEKLALCEETIGQHEERIALYKDVLRKLKSGEQPLDELELEE